VSAPAAPSRNVELKASDPNPERSQELCRKLGAADHNIIWQRDTYFNVTHGRLKLREKSAGKTELIQYERADRPEERESSYRVFELEDGDALREVLVAALGLYGVVEKRRHLFLWQQVRIHLDEVEGLGHFVELEAVAPAHSDLSREYQQVAFLRRELGITDERLCATGYLAQLRAAAS
jgi:predicted adenylyl cyclase CyaB